MGGDSNVGRTKILFFWTHTFFEFIKIQHLKVFVVILDGSLAQCKYLSLRHLHHCWDEKDTRPSSNRSRPQSPSFLGYKLSRVALGTRMSSNMFKTTLAHARSVFLPWIFGPAPVYVCVACHTRYARFLSPIETYAGQHYLKDKAV